MKVFSMFKKEKNLTPEEKQIVAAKRSDYLREKRSRLKNQTPSIISNSCISGTIYRDLGLQYFSPTVDSLIRTPDFFKFLNRLPEYLKSDMVEAADTGVSYPVGILRLDDEEICVHFMHSKNFEEARNKWLRRAQRVNLDNLYIVFGYPGRLVKRNPIYRQFKQLPYAHKRMLAFPLAFMDSEVVPIPIYFYGHKPGKILLYPGPASTKKYLDSFDYVKFLNEE